jgi:hypothetical protein
MRETEWKVTCPNGHATYDRVRDIPANEVRFTDCPTCGALRRAEQLLPPR